jgi:single-stranded DNA-binding protein
MIKKRPLNTVLLVGRICQAPRLSTSRSGKPRLTVTLAVDRPEYVPPKVKRAKKKDGTERVRIEPDFPVVVIEGDLARELAQQTVMGAILFVRGIFQTRNIEDRSANRHRVAMEVLANDARILELDAQPSAAVHPTTSSAPPAVAVPSPAVASQAPRAETVDSTVSIPKQVGGLP